MKIIGLTRVRNEEKIIEDTLNHMATFCQTVIVYDDVSDDNTVEICKKHPIVSKIIIGNNWDSNRARSEYQTRHAIYLEARKICDSNDWIVYMDADERICFDWSILKKQTNIDAIRMKLFDYYITTNDVNKNYYEREWIGPEYRNIIFAFRFGATTGYHHLDQRECSLKPKSKILHNGYVKHYGKAISVEEWEKTCDYYGNHFPMYSKKWLNRKGKAIHTKSDFGRPLIKWEDKDKYGIPL